MNPRRLLVVTYYYPPQPGSGSNRWAAMSSHLRRLGHEVTVITAAPPGHDAGAADGVLRTTSLNSNEQLRRLLLRADRSSARPVCTAAPNRVMPPLLWKAVVPDPWLATWNPYAWRAMRAQLRGRSFDCLITSSPADSTHLLALALRGRRPPWVADFRDGWRFEPLRPRFPSRAQRALDGALERRVATAADAVVGATAPIAEDLGARFGVSALHIPNGFDPDTQVDASLPDWYDRDRIALVHTGPLLGPRGRDPRPLLAALREVLDERAEWRERVRLLVAGRSEFDERPLLADSGLKDAIQLLGYLPRPQALALQRAATALVLLTSPARCEATGKLYEYMAAARPIIALADGNEAARIVRETGTGIVVAPDDREAIAVALRAALDGSLERAYAPQGLEPYTYPAPARRMAEAVEAAIAARSARR